MSTLKRKFVNKRKSTRSFRRGASRTKAANVNSSPMRGGYRL